MHLLVSVSGLSLTFVCRPMDQLDININYKNSIVQLKVFGFALLIMSRYCFIMMFGLCFRGMFDIYVKIDGADKKVGSYDNKGSFGELALMYNLPRAATIIATTEGSLWAMVSKEEVNKLLKKRLNIS